MIRLLRGLLERVRVLVRRDRFETELDDELRFHLGESTRHNLHRGMSPAEAKRAARRSLGRTDATKEQVRNETGVGRIHAWLDVSLLDLKLGLRMLVKYPGLSFVAGMAMAAISTGAQVSTKLLAAATVLATPEVNIPEFARAGNEFRIE